MSSLKERFDNFTQQPDPKVWENIASSMAANARRRNVRRAVAAGTAVAVVAAALLVYFNTRPDSAANSSKSASGPVVAINNIAAPSQSNPKAEEITVVDFQSDDAVQPAAVQPVAVDGQKVNVTTSNEASVPAQVAASPSASQPAAAVSQPTAQSQPASNAVAESKPVVSHNSNSDAVAQNQASTSNKPVDSKASEGTPYSGKAANDSLSVWIPNAFSPNDPSDDVRLFKVIPSNDASVLSFEIYIYNRGGRMVFHSRDINQGWDGTSNGYDQPMGTYVYVIELRDAVKGIQHKRGTLTLIR